MGENGPTKFVFYGVCELKSWKKSYKTNPQNAFLAILTVGHVKKVEFFVKNLKRNFVCEM